MSSLLLLQIIFLFIFFFKGLKPIKIYMINYQKKKKKNEELNPPKKIKKESKDINNINIEKVNNNINLENNYYNEKQESQNIKDINDNKESYCINMDKIFKQEINKKNKKKNTYKLNTQSFSKSELVSFNNSNLIKNKDKELFDKKNIQESNIQSHILNINDNIINQEKYSKGKIKEMISENKNKEGEYYTIKTKKRKTKRIKSRTKNIKETIAENDKEENSSKKKEISVRIELTNDEIQDMDYEEAIIYDKRTFLKMYWSYLLDSQIILGTFLTENHLNLLIIKISLFINIFAISFFLNAIFYTDEYISNAYYNNGILDFVSGLPKSIYSFLVTLITTNLFQMLSNSKAELMKLIRENSNNKRYKKFIKVKLNKLKNKLIIYFILVFTLGLLFLYYVSAFCAVYRYSQKYWFYGCLESFGMDFLIAFITSLFLSLLRYISIKKKKKFFLVLANIIGTFL